MLIKQFLILFTGSFLPLCKFLLSWGITFNHNSSYKLFLISQYHYANITLTGWIHWCLINFSPVLLHCISLITTSLWDFYLHQPYHQIQHWACLMHTGRPSSSHCLPCTGWRVLVRVSCLGPLKNIAIIVETFIILEKKLSYKRGKILLSFSFWKRKFPN